MSKLIIEIGESEMRFDIIELLWLFLCYSFLGWMLETITAAIKHKHFANKGLINGPLCIIYGITTCTVSIFFHELSGVWLFAASTIMATLVEWLAGHLIEKCFHEKWWDYSHRKWNLDGYICAGMSLIWGLLCTFAVSIGNNLLLKLFYLIPALAGDLLVSALAVIFVLDVLASLIILQGRSKNLERWENVDAWLDSLTSNLGKRIYRRVNKRIENAYPEAVHKEAAEKETKVFAHGCSFHKIWWLFIIGAFLGDLVETIYCRLVGGIWMSRSSVVWGPFSIVWGLAIAAATVLLYKYKDRSDSFLFAAGTFLGGAYEYICSVFTEIMFGQVFWDYSWMPFNLGGRINLLYCFFWGLAAVVWIKFLYPKFSAWIEKVPVKPGKIISWVLIVFMSCNILVSCMALVRVNERDSGVPATSQWQEIMDQRFDDERMQKIYPNAVNVR